MWFFIGLIAGTFIGFLVSGILQMARKGDEIYEKAYAKRNNDPFDHFMPERRRGERRNSQ